MVREWHRWVVVITTDSGKPTPWSWHSSRKQATTAAARFKREPGVIAVEVKYMPDD